MTLISTAAKGASGATVATTVAGLGGSPASGAVGYLRAGSSPYETVALVYDGTLGAWVSAVHTGVSEIGTAGTTTTSALYAELTPSDLYRAIVPDYLSLYNAGLRLQALVGGFLSNSGGGNTTSIRAAMAQVSDADTAIGAVFATGADHSITGATATYAIGTWETLTIAQAPTKQHGALIFQAKVTAGTGNLVRLFSLYRFVSA